MTPFLSRAAAVLLAASLSLIGCAGVAPSSEKSEGRSVPAGANQNEFVIAGRVTDAKGLPVAYLPVQIFSSFRPVLADPRLDLGEVDLLTEGETSSDGSYRVVIRVLPGKNHYYLNFYDPKRFDIVRFARPNRIDITDRVNPGVQVAYNHRLAFHGAWAKVQETLKAYPKGSPKARVIRLYGIAEEIRKPKEGGETEVWWYYSRGMSFEFQGDKLSQENSFTPVLK
jgi:hypothetical protein